MVSQREKIQFIFNKYFFDFVEDVIATCPELAEQVSHACKVRNLNTSKHLTRFVEEVKKNNVQDAICSSTIDDVFSHDGVKTVKIIKGVPVQSIVDANKDEKGVASYIFIFTLFASLYDVEDEDEQEVLFNLYINAIKSVQNDEEPNLDGIYDKRILRLIENIKVAKVKKHNHDEDDDDASDATASILANSKIGSLAQEISKDIDLGSLNIEKPEDVFNLAGGSGGGANALGDIIGKVSSKIHEKINTGEIKHEELMSEALGMLSMLNKSGNNPFVNNPMMQEVMKAMGKKGASGLAANDQRGRASEKREQLKAKLAARKEQKM